MRYYLDDPVITRISKALHPIRIGDQTDRVMIEGQRRAAVMLALTKRAEAWHVLLTLRPDTMPTHAGQIAFPGGRIEAGETARAAAIRETQEEVGIGEQDLMLIGRLDSFNAASSFRVTPFVGIYHPEAQIIPDPREVADAFEAPLSFFMDPDNHKPRTVEYKGQDVKLYDMPYTGHDGIARNVWGMTAMMLYRLYQRAYVGNFTHPDEF